MPNLSRHEAEDILYREARLLNERRYWEWLELFGADARYWIPCNGEGKDPEREITLVYDDLHRLRDSVERLASGMAHAQTPPSRTKRLISNVEIDSSTEDAATVSSGFILYELRRSRERVFAGRYEHSLRRVEGSWKIATKKVVLINNDEVIDNLTFIV